MSLLHSGVDGRTAFTLMDLYLKFLRDELEGRAGPISLFQWGTEIIRLQLPGAFALAIAETGYLPKISSDSKKQKSELPATVRSSSFIFHAYSKLNIYVRQFGGIHHCVRMGMNIAMARASLHSRVKQLRS